MGRVRRDGAVIAALLLIAPGCDGTAPTASPVTSPAPVTSPPTTTPASSTTPPAAITTSTTTPGTSPATTQGVAPTTSATTLSLPPVGDGIRYLDPIFGAIETVENVVYWPDAAPRTETVYVGVADLTMDIHRPAGDTDSGRPVIVALEMRSGSWVVDDFVRRGYVVVTPTVRARPSSPSPAALDETVQGMVDAAAAVRYLRANADELGLHPDAIAATGYSGAGIVAMALAWGQQNDPAVTDIDLFGVLPVRVDGGGPDLGDYLADQPSAIAAAFPMAAWYPPELVDAGEPPALFFNGTEDPTYPFAAVEQICPAAEAVGVSCTLRTFPTGHFLGNETTLSVESARFLYEQMLAPRGIVDPATVPVETPDPAELGGSEPLRIPSPESGPEPDPPWELTILGLAAGDDGTVYVATGTSIATLEDGRAAEVELEGLPRGRLQAEGCSEPRIEAIAVGPDGQLWVAGSSLSTPDDAAFGGTQTGDWICNEVRRLAWIAVRDCDAESCAWDVFRSDEIAAIDDSDSFESLALGADRTLAAVTTSGWTSGRVLVTYDGSWVRQQVPVTDPAIIHLAVGDRGSIWLASSSVEDEESTLTEVDGSVVTRHTDIPPGWIDDLEIGHDGTLWLAATTPGSVASFDGVDWTIVDVGDPDVLGRPQTIAAGSGDVVWATFTGHHARFDGEHWQLWPTDLPAWGMTAVDSDDTLWRAIGTALVSFDGTDETIHPSPFRP